MLLPSRTCSTMAVAFDFESQPVVDIDKSSCAREGSGKEELLTINFSTFVLIDECLRIDGHLEMNCSLLFAGGDNFVQSSS